MNIFCCTYQERYITILLGNPYFKPHFCETNKVMVSKSMNDISSLRDYYIADAITDIQSMSRDELERKLINIETEKIEHMTDDEILRFKQQHHDS